MAFNRFFGNRVRYRPPPGLLAHAHSCRPDISMRLPVAWVYGERKRLTVMPEASLSTFSLFIRFLKILQCSMYRETIVLVQSIFPNHEDATQFYGRQGFLQTPLWKR